MSSKTLDPSDPAAKRFEDLRKLQQGSKSKSSKAKSEQKTEELKHDDQR